MRKFILDIYKSASDFCSQLYSKVAIFHGRFTQLLLVGNGKIFERNEMNEGTELELVPPVPFVKQSP